MEAKIIKRGNFYLTPFTKDHVEEVISNLSPENVREINLLGYQNVRECIEEMMQYSDCYLVRKDGEVFTAISGLWYEDGRDTPQFFAMFSKNIKENFTSMARGSRMLVNFFDRTQSEMSMRILGEHQFMLDWASWLGFEAIGVTEFNSNHYVDFVRCISPQKNVYSETSRPVMH